MLNSISFEFFPRFCWVKSKMRLRQKQRHESSKKITQPLLHSLAADNILKSSAEVYEHPGVQSAGRNSDEIE